MITSTDVIKSIVEKEVREAKEVKKEKPAAKKDSKNKEKIAKPFGVKMADYFESVIGFEDFKKKFNINKHPHNFEKKKK